MSKLMGTIRTRRPMRALGRRLRARLGLGSRPGRRGVVSVLSMMFLILFGSLAAAMAVMSRGNITTAATHQHVSRALSAAETGLAIAESRLREAASRFVSDRGEIDGEMGWRLWTGDMGPSQGKLQRDPPTSFASSVPADGIVDALVQAHLADRRTVEVAGISEPTIGPAPSGFDPEEYRPDHWLRTPGIAVTSAGDETVDTAFTIEYLPLAREDSMQIRVRVTGLDYSHMTRGEPIRRTISKDFELTKRVRSSLLGPSKIMIGKNVLVTGDLGARFNGVTHDKGDPVVLKSDFRGIDARLDSRLAKLYMALKTHDRNRDNRLRVDHPDEMRGIPDFDGSGTSDGTAADVNFDGYVDEMDCFIAQFDTSPKDGKVVLSEALTKGTPHEGMTPEFVDPTTRRALDDDLALLLDSSMPDRNRNGVAGFIDADGDGRFDPEDDKLVDVMPADGDVPAEWRRYVKETPDGPVVWADQVLGFRDGVIDSRDLYAKVRGQVILRTTEAAWRASGGDFMSRLRGAIDPQAGKSPMVFGAGSRQLPEVTPASFTTSESALRAIATGQSKDFWRQVRDSLEISESELAAWTASKNPTDPTEPRFFPVLPDANEDGLPDNWDAADGNHARWEVTPWGSPNVADYYYRPIFENMVFTNVTIPMGLNARFVNCTFIGVTYIRSRTDNGHVNWTRYGRLKLSSGSPQRPVLDPDRVRYGDDPTETRFPPSVPPGDRLILITRNIEEALDKGDITGERAGVTQGVDRLPDPLIINGLRVVDTKAFSNNIRFHNSLFVGSVISDAPSVYTHVRNKVQFTGSTRFTDKHPKYPDDPKLNPTDEELKQIRKSSMMMPQFSVDVGHFNSPPTQNIQLRGLIVAGVLDVRGYADVTGAVLTTFEPIPGRPPLIDAFGAAVGNPALFNSTIGYFGPADGDEEAVDPTLLPRDAAGNRFVGWDLDGDGMPDLRYDQTPTAAQVAAGATRVPFHGFGAVTITFDPRMTLPDGIMLPLELDGMSVTYWEGVR